MPYEVQGVDRDGEVGNAVHESTALIVDHGERVTGYATDIAYCAHAVGESNDDLKALIGSVSEYGGPGFLLPARNAELMRWCLEHSLRVVQMMTLMSVGFYREPTGAWVPSVPY